MSDFWNSFWSDESGQGLVEYALIIALVSIGLMLVLISFRDQLAQVFRDIRDELLNASVNQAPA